MNDPEEWDRMHFAAIDALLGRSSTPEREIAALLRSNFPLDRTVRDLLAGALEGRPTAGGITLCVSPRDKASRISATYHKNMKLGLEAIKRQQLGQKYDDILRDMAEEFRVSEKSIEAAKTQAAKRERWVEDKLNSLGEGDRDGLHRFFCEWLYDGKVIK